MSDRLRASIQQLNGVRPLSIKSGRSEIYFDPKDGALRLRFDGHGLLQVLTPEQCCELAAFLTLSAKKRHHTPD